MLVKIWHRLKTLFTHNDSKYSREPSQVVNTVRPASPQNTPSPTRTDSCDAALCGGDSAPCCDSDGDSGGCGGD